ncbi:MAG: FeoA family protein [Atribacterota bacterium]|jgi:ferrous iron transport protein A|nr:FeoA family protein [Atribacterota bacterium]MDI9597105.1 FeoA family protein [Atribacterota bacterium]
MIISLTDVKSGSSVKVVRIRGGLSVRQRLSCLGIHPGDTILLQKCGFMRGPVLVNIHGNQVALGRGIAAKILVEVEA